MRSAVLSMMVVLCLAGCGSGSTGPGAGITGVNFVGVSVSDIEQSTDFYAAADLQAVEAPAALDAVAQLLTPGQRDIRSRLLRSSNAQLRLMEFQAQDSGVGPVPVQGPGIAHVCYQVNRDTAAYQDFLDAGAQPIGDAQMVRLSERSPVEYAYAHDPDGIVFEVEHVDVGALDLDAPPKNDYRIRHVSLATPDMDAAIEFYSGLLGGQEPRRLGRWFAISGDKVDRVSGLAGSALEMAWFQVRNLELEIVQYSSHPTDRPGRPRPLSAPGYNMIVFDVDDLDLARQSLLAAGGTVVTEAARLDGGEILFGRDPDGNLLGFQRVAAESPLSSGNFADNGI